MAEPAVLPAAYEYPPLRGGKLLFLTAAIATASFMEILDMTIVNVSVPAISGSLGVSTSEGTWAISSYMLAAAIMQPLTGWIGRRSARSELSSLPFCCSCVLGAVRTRDQHADAGGGRLIQGLVSGTMMSVAQAILLRNYPIERRGMAIALWAMVDHHRAYFRAHHRRLDHRQSVVAVAVLYQFAGGRLRGGGELVDSAPPRIEEVKIAHRRGRARAAGHRRRQPAVHARQRQ
jgi:hypothetical protein